MNRTRPVSRPVLFQACGTLRGKNAQVPGPPTLISSTILKVISPASTQATSSLSRCRWNMLLVPTGTVSSNSMMLSLVSWPTSFRAAKRPGAPMSRCFPPSAGITKPLVASIVMPSLWLRRAACVERPHVAIPRETDHLHQAAAFDQHSVCLAHEREIAERQLVIARKRVLHPCFRLFGRAGPALGIQMLRHLRVCVEARIERQVVRRDPPQNAAIRLQPVCAVGQRHDEASAPPPWFTPPGGPERRPRP